MKIALGIEYNGSHYYGWQRQQHVTSVQAELEGALSKVANQPISVFCAGRTDTGVHATGQVVHFETDVVREAHGWIMGTNTHLSANIAVTWAMPVSEEFHARFSALARRYRYIIYNHPFRPAILSRGITHYHQLLDEAKMHRAAQYLLGENDFSAFRAAQCQSKSPWRNVHHVNVTRQGRYIVIDIQANAFVHHMVRNIVGSLLEIGSGNQPEAWLHHLMQMKDRTRSAATAKPEGLYLVNVTYPEQFQLPITPLGPLFL